MINLVTLEEHEVEKLHRKTNLFHSGLMCLETQRLTIMLTAYTLFNPHEYETYIRTVST